jgi:hypothetical protein
MLWDDKRAWSISQATEEALRRLRPEGHVLTPQESRQVERLLKKQQQASKERDMISYLRASTDLLGAASRSYSRHLRSPSSSSESRGVRSSVGA